MEFNMTYEELNSQDGMAPIVKASAFNDAFTYSFVSRAPFYAMIPARYQPFMNRFVKNWLWWYDGWVPYFHSAENGIPSTRLATALVDRAAKKVVGGRILYKNAGKESGGEPNAALSHISAWTVSTDFEKTVKEAVKYAAAAGTSCIKLNRDAKGLWSEALRFDSFLPTIGARGEVVDVAFFLNCFTDLGGSHVREGSAFTAFYVVEWRHFADYKTAEGYVMRGAPIVEYAIKTAEGTITNGEFVSANMRERVPFRELPPAMRKTIGRSYPDIMFDEPCLLPYVDSLGCQIVTWTDGISSIPELPFGESFLSPIISDLISYDYYHAAANTDMYLGRGRVLVPKYMTAGVTPSGEANTGLSRMLFVDYTTNDPDSKGPVFMQPELRAGDWQEIRNRIVQDISINTGLNASTIASFMHDGSAKTAREVSTEENETAEFVNDKRAIIEKPINRVLKTVLRFYGYADDVVIRWSSAGITNRFTLAEILQVGLASGFISRRKAVEMFNYDDDVHQIEDEIHRIEEDLAEGVGDALPGMEGMIDADGAEPDESADDGADRGARGDQAGGQALDL